MKLTVLIMISLFCFSALSEVGPATLAPGEAKLRLYPGGQDEENLQVQEELPEAKPMVTKRQLHSEVKKKLLKKKAEEEGTSETTTQ